MRSYLRIALCSIPVLVAGGLLWAMWHDVSQTPLKVSHGGPGPYAVFGAKPGTLVVVPCDNDPWDHAPNVWMHDPISNGGPGPGLCARWRDDHQGRASSDRNIVWTLCDDQLTEFVPDLPARMVIDYSREGPSFAVSRVTRSYDTIPRSSDYVVFHQSLIDPTVVAAVPAQRIKPQCWYWNGTRVVSLTLANGRRVRVPCEGRAQ